MNKILNVTFRKKDAHLVFMTVFIVFGCFQLFCNHVQLNLFCDTLYFSDFFCSFSSAGASVGKRTAKKISTRCVRYCVR